MTAIRTNAGVHDVTPFGVTPGGQRVELHTLTNRNGLEVRFINLGGAIVSMKVPDRRGNLADVTTGYDSFEDYLADANYFGALIGRYANRIAGGRFVIDEVCFQLPRNAGDNLLHGGATGFHRAFWRVEPFTTETSVGAVLHHTSAAGEGGFPGTLAVRVTYALTDHNELRIDYAATTDAPTPLTLTQHSYFNLAGHDSGDILDHVLTVAASRYLPVDDALIPTGELRSVEGTPFDFRTPRAIGAAMRGDRNNGPAQPGGFDHSFVLDGESRGTLRLAARLYEPLSGRVLEVETTEPALQLYTGNGLNGVRGKGAHSYGPYAALALETQHFPNSPNEPSFPSTILRPGQAYTSRTVYRFLVA